MEVTEQKFIKEGLNLHAYIFKVGDTNFLVTGVNNDSKWNVDDESCKYNYNSLTGSEDN